jgi:hypothetical protein
MVVGAGKDGAGLGKIGEMADEAGRRPEFYLRPLEN